MLSHTRVKIIRLAITVASSDAANTALLYGAVSPAVAFLLETLEQFTHLEIASDAPVGVQADFTAQQCRADVHLRFRWRVIHLLDILFRTMFHMISNQSKRSS